MKKSSKKAKCDYDNRSKNSSPNMSKDHDNSEAKIAVNDLLGLNESSEMLNENAETNLESIYNPYSRLYGQDNNWLQNSNTKNDELKLNKANNRNDTLANSKNQKPQGVPTEKPARIQSAHRKILSADIDTVLNANNYDGWKKCLGKTNSKIEDDFDNRLSKAYDKQRNQQVRAFNLNDDEQRNQQVKAIYLNNTENNGLSNRQKMTKNIRPATAKPGLYAKKPSISNNQQNALYRHKKKNKR